MAVGAGLRPWARGGAAWDRQPWAGAAAGRATAAGRRASGAAGERDGGDVGRRHAGGGGQNGSTGAGVERACGERNRKEEERHGGGYFE